MPRGLDDSAIFEAISKLGLTASNLFLAAGQVFVSRDASMLDASSSYERVTGLSADTYEGLVGLLRRLDRPEYASIQAVEDQIQNLKDWELMYSELNAILDRYGQRDGGDFLVVEDNYGYLQQNVACATPGWFIPEMIQPIQAMLGRFRERWEVLVVGEGADHKPFTLSVYKDTVITQDVENK